MGKYFGTDGFRGEANVDLTVEHGWKISWMVLFSKWKSKSGNWKRYT